MELLPVVVNVKSKVNERGQERCISIISDVLKSNISVVAGHFAKGDSLNPFFEEYSWGIC